jgi:hypothetical protein
MMISYRGVVIGLIGVAVSVGMSVPLAAQAPGGAAQSPPSDADLAQQLSNPVASLVSVPLQFNWDQRWGWTTTRASRSTSSGRADRAERRLEPALK